MASCRPPPPRAAATPAAAAATVAARAAATPGAAAIHAAATPSIEQRTPVQAVTFWRRVPTLQQQQSLSPVRHRHP